MRDFHTPTPTGADILAALVLVATVWAACWVFTLVSVAIHGHP